MGNNAALRELVDNLAAALESCMAHYGDQMPAQDRLQRNSLIKKAYKASYGGKEDSKEIPLPFCTRCETHKPSEEMATSGGKDICNNCCIPALDLASGKDTTAYTLQTRCHACKKLRVVDKDCEECNIICPHCGTDGMQD